MFTKLQHLVDDRDQTFSPPQMPVSYEKMFRLENILFVENSIFAASQKELY